MATSRGNAISAYSPAFSKGAQVYGANIASGVVTSAHIADGTVVAGDIGAGSITSAKIGTGAVTSIKLGAAAVISAKIGVSAVQYTNIAVNAVRNGAISAKSITSAKIRAAFLSGTIVSGRTTRAIAHGLGVKPKFVVVAAMPTLTQANISASATANQVFLAAASAATSANFYVIGTQAANAAIKYCAYVQL